MAEDWLVKGNSINKWRKLNEENCLFKFFITYDVGLAGSVLTMFAHGVFVELGNEPLAAFSRIAGLGHILLTIGFGLFFFVLISSINQQEAKV